MPSTDDVAQLVAALATGEKLMSWYDLAETTWHSLDGTQLYMTALQGLLDAGRGGRFDELRTTPLP